MKFKVKEIAQLLQGVIIGNNEVEISGFNGLELAEEGDISFCDSLDYLDLAIKSKASVLIIPKELDSSGFDLTECSLIEVENPRIGLATLLWHYKNVTNPYNGISTQANISDSAQIGDSCYIGNVSISDNSTVKENCQIHDGVIIGRNVTIGKGCIMHPGVKILNDSVIGDYVTIQSNAIIGSDGFGFVPNTQNKYMKIPHIGNVILEDHVEIGAGTCIDRGTMGSTIIRKGVKLDNLIQIAHNVEIGENTVIAAQTGIAGSAKIGKNCMIGGQVGIVGHISIADGVKIAAQSGIGNAISEEGSIYQGSPAFKIRDYKMSYVGFKKLPQLMKEIHSMKNQLEKLISKQ